MKEPKVWDQRPGESGAAYSAFLAYRDLGRTRSVASAYRFFKATLPGAKKSVRKAKKEMEAKQAGGKPGRIKDAPGRWRTWYADFEWKKRAEAWDAHGLAVGNEAYEDAIRIKAFDLVGLRADVLNAMARAAKNLAEGLEGLTKGGKCATRTVRVKRMNDNGEPMEIEDTVSLREQLDSIKDTMRFIDPDGVPTAKPAADTSGLESRVVFETYGDGS